MSRRLFASAHVAVCRSMDEIITEELKALKPACAIKKLDFQDSSHVIRDVKHGGWEAPACPYDFFRGMLPFGGVDEVCLTASYVAVVAGFFVCGHA